MLGFLRKIRHGEPLVHFPIAMHDDAPPAVEFMLEKGAAGESVSGRLTPLSLLPFRIGLLGSSELLAHATDPPRLTVRAGGSLVGQMRVDVERTVQLGGCTVTVVRPSRARNLSVPPPRRWWLYALAARRVAADQRPGNLLMSASDLRCLDVFMIEPRPVYLVTVRHGDSFNLFPMNLVSYMGTAGFFLALRSSSPSIPFMKEDGRLVFSSVPAACRDAIYRLGAHHSRPYNGVDDVGFVMTTSPEFGLPTPAEAFRVREFQVVDHVEIGSHVVFMAEQKAISGRGGEPQLGHVSAMFAEYAARTGSPLEPA